MNYTNLTNIFNVSKREGKLEKRGKILEKRGKMGVEWRKFLAFRVEKLVGNVEKLVFL